MIRLDGRTSDLSSQGLANIDGDWCKLLVVADGFLLAIRPSISLSCQIIEVVALHSEVRRVVVRALVLLGLVNVLAIHAYNSLLTLVLKS